MKKIVSVLAMISIVFLSMISVTGCTIENESGQNSSSTVIDENQLVLELEQPLDDEIVVMYGENVKKYLNSPSANVASFASFRDEGYRPLEVRWKGTNDKDVLSYKVELSRNKDFSEAEVKEVKRNLHSVTFDNLFKNCNYYVRLTASLKDKNVVVESSFKTSSKGPRPLKIDGIANVRDLGGYKTESGKYTRQGLIYRGGSLSSTSDYPVISLSAKGEKYMREVLKIKYDMDLRGNKEGGVSESPIKGAMINWFGIDGYASAFAPRYKDCYLNVFKTFADENNYPIYMHCTGGADRTGTVAFLFNALLGVDKITLINDYEYTTFSVYGERNSETGIYGDMFTAFLTKFESYKGLTYAEKAENYLLEIGLSKAEIENIKTIMIEE